MKNIFLLFIYFSLFQNSYSQTLLERERINKSLIERFENEEEQRKLRISNFLRLNPDFKIDKYFENRSHYILYDIVEGKPIFKTTYNLNAAIATKTTHLHPGGELGLNLDGTGMTVGVWDGGPIEIAHPEFQNINNSQVRASNIESSTVDGDQGISSHATHVSGTISAKGVNQSARGMAPNINIITYNWINDESEMTQAASSVNPILLSNHSYGISVTQNDGSTLDAWFMGAYNNDARDIDAILHNNPNYLIVASAGNAGSVSYNGSLFPGFDKLTGDKNAKNSLVIANANPTIIPFSNEINTLNINQGSSQGPTDDLRIKPDIAGDGTDVLSTVPGGGYASFTGTSMSAPNVTGSLALLQQYYNQLNSSFMLSSTLKALVCHTAIDDISRPGPDPVFGWGFLNTRASADVISDAINNNSIMEEISLLNGTSYTDIFNVGSGEKLVVTIAWTDLPGPPVPNGTLNNQTPRLVNDLDLRLTKDGVTFFPWKLEYDQNSGFSNSKGDNFRDNVEKIEIEVPTSGSYTLTVTHKGTLQGNSGGPFDPQSQTFSLIVTGDNLTLSDESFKVNSITLFPNPTSDFISVSGLTDEFEYDVFNIQGKVLSNGKIDSINNQIDLSSLSNGIYIIRIGSGDNFITKKIIKK